ncbi:MoxR family ATPase [Lentisphaera profundi]|uniref:MoxR family ATPase n=1 Tax=Lentisphaera profundi TaxID=1658616 RepID=A0ABY7VYJ3_9BACT|nr:MoxR family ATPase [Lentisphaera profundi]WDE98275.1 MoxR family ATPase [Lentisphaera profundi]
MDQNDLVSKITDVKAVLNTVIRGKENVVDLLLTGLFSGGHCLIEDVPGVGKTSLAKAVAKSVGCEFQRVQFTPDLLPADITGGPIYSQKQEEFFFKKGPVFCNILLADEINRASPRTQSALLEAMGENQVTIGGERYDLPPPFIVIATQNSIDNHGTFPLPEAQLDRFALSFSMGYPDAESELAILLDRHNGDPGTKIEAQLSSEEVLQIQEQVRKVKVDESIASYIVAILNSSRQQDQLRTGCSPRTGLVMYRTAQAHAYLNGRDYVIADDIKHLSVAVLSHRLHVKKQVKNSGISNEEIVREFFDRVKPPH